MRSVNNNIITSVRDGNLFETVSAQSNHNRVYIYLCWHLSYTSVVCVIDY